MPPPSKAAQQRKAAALIGSKAAAAASGGGGGDPPVQSHNTPIVILAMITFATYIPPLCNAIVYSKRVFMVDNCVPKRHFIWEGLGVGGCEAGTRGRLLRAKHAMPGPAIVQADAWGPPRAHHMYSGRMARAHSEH